MKVGVAGCGRMGLPMARALQRGRVDTLGFDIRTGGDFENLEMCFDPARFAQGSDVLLSVVRNEAQTEALLFGPSGLAPYLKQGATLLISSTLEPGFVQSLPERLPKGIRLIDAPFIGDPITAEGAQLTFLLGGEVRDYDEISLLLAHMGQTQIATGPLGSAMSMALLNAFVAANSVAAVRTALDAAQSQGLDGHVLLDVLGEGDGQTWFGSNFNRLAFARAGISPENTLGYLEREAAKISASLPSAPARNYGDTLLDVMRHMESLNLPMRER